MLRHFISLRAAATARNYSSINCNTHYNVVFVRHGQSTWNRDNRFIGWTDTPLTGTPGFEIGFSYSQSSAWTSDEGVLEARLAGRMLSSSGILFDEAHTSLLRRSIRTTNLVLMEMGQEYIPGLLSDEAIDWFEQTLTLAPPWRPVSKHWRLNEVDEIR